MNKSRRSIPVLPRQIIGKHIVLRQLELSDAPELLRYARHRAIRKWTDQIPYPYTRRVAEQFIRHSQRVRAKSRQANYAITLKDYNKVIGMISYKKIEWEHNSADLGYWIAAPFWNRGLMTEAVTLLSRLAFEKLKLHRLKAGIYPENKASARVLTKVGFIHEGTLRKPRFRYGRWHDVLFFSMLESDWKKARAKI